MRSLSRALGLVALLALPLATPAYADPVIGQPLYKVDDLRVRFLGADAFYTDDVYFFLSAASQEFLFSNHSTDPLAVLADPDDNALAFGAEVIFSICATTSGAVPGNPCSEADHILYSGNGSLNFDGLPHVKVWSAEAYFAEFGDVNVQGYDYVIGFEDIIGGGDEDYNDAIFAVRGVSTVPEPMTMTLLATGLAGMGFMRKRRR